jgi:3-isopropylmalate dehydrogenase
MYVDACAMRLALDPTYFDVVLAENLFGDILSDQAAAVAGSIGVLPSATIGGLVDLYEPVHGSAPDLAGKDCANPIGAIASAAMLVRHTARLPREAALIEDAIRDVLARGIRPPDLARPGAPAASTTEVGEAIEGALRESIDHRHAYHAV